MELETIRQLASVPPPGAAGARTLHFRTLSTALERIDELEAQLSAEKVTFPPATGAMNALAANLRIRSLEKLLKASGEAPQAPAAAISAAIATHSEPAVKLPVANAPASTEAEPAAADWRDTSLSVSERSRIYREQQAAGQIKSAAQDSRSRLDAQLESFRKNH